MSEAGTARLFFAAWPAPEVQHALHGIARQFQRECGGRTMAQRNIHLTLVFLGNVERARLPQFKSVAGAVTAPGCELVIDRVEYWRRNRVLWAGVERCPEALRSLVAGLAAGLRAVAFEPEDRPYVPHVTLLRDARRAPAKSAVGTIAWPVRDFALIESVPRGGARVYEVLRRWPLGG